MTFTIGSILKQARHDQQLSQQQVANDICSQPMLSAIEHDQYTPNAALLLALCERLAINLEELSLADNYAINRQQAFNQRVSELCNQHRYAELAAYLVTDAVLEGLETAAQYQAYDYYLGVATLQSTDKPDYQAVLQRLAVSRQSGPQRKANTLTRLALVASAYVTGKLQQPQRALQLVNEALADIAQTPYESNLNAVYYLAALTAFELKQFNQSTQWLTTGITFATDHDSHYMLANDYYLLAKLAVQVETETDALEATHRSKIMAELFDERIYRQI